MISMSQHIHNLMGESMKGLRDLVDVDCIVGKPIVTASNTTIIPISKVTFGFGSGGSDIAKSTKDDLAEQPVQGLPSSRCAF